MAMTRAQKETEVASLQNMLDASELVILTHNTGLDAASMSALRLKMRQGGVRYKVAKNTLTRRAIEGTKFEKIGDMLSGPVGLAASADTVAAAKIAHEYAKENDKLVILGGAMGEIILDKAAVEQLAKLPSLDELRSKIVGLLQAPATKLAGIMQAPARDLVGVTKAYGEKG